MQFCEICDNMYYIQINSKIDNELTYYCKKCGNENNNISEDNMCVLTTNFKKKDTKYKHIINKYTKYDPSLPHILLHCPSDTCSSNKEGTNKQSDVIYIRYNNEQMKHVYMCTLCDYSWVSE